MSILPDYQIGELLAETAAVQVYRARRRADDAPVVLKRLKNPEPAPDELARLRREFEILRQLAAPEIVTALDWVSAPGWHALALEDFGGLPLTRAVTAGQLALADFLNLALKLTRAVQHVHQRRFIHKDLNPDNILLNPASGQLKLIDFSIASSLASEQPDPRGLEGTLAYLSPEQTGRVNRTVDARTDLYALGVVFYQLLSGRCPLKARNRWRWSTARSPSRRRRSAAPPPACRRRSSKSSCACWPRTPKPAINPAPGWPPTCRPAWNNSRRPARSNPLRSAAAINPNNFIRPNNCTDALRKWPPCWRPLNAPPTRTARPNWR